MRNWVSVLFSTQCGSVVKKKKKTTPPACQCWRHRLYPLVEIISWEGNCNPLQYPCLGNPMDRGACWAIVLGVAKNQTQLNDQIWAHDKFTIKLIFFWSIELNEFKKYLLSVIYILGCILHLWCLYFSGRELNQHKNTQIHFELVNIKIHKFISVF